jgi:hypothetical protein
MGSAASVKKTTPSGNSATATIEVVADSWNTKIGNAVHKMSLDNLLGNMTMGFTQDERMENEKVEKTQKSTGTFVIAHNFYGFPTKASKHNVRDGITMMDQVSFSSHQLHSSVNPFVG